MCQVCKTDQKCTHPWAQCMASRGEYCAACGHTSWAPRRPPDPTPSTSSTRDAVDVRPHAPAPPGGHRSPMLAGDSLHEGTKGSRATREPLVSDVWWGSLGNRYATRSSVTTASISPGSATMRGASTEVPDVEVLPVGDARGAVPAVSRYNSAASSTFSTASSGVMPWA